MSNKKNIGDRIKDQYETRSNFKLTGRTYTIIRVDGKQFKNYTKGLIRPYDVDFINDMNQTAVYLAKNIQGAKLAYCQSDEISVVLTDFDTYDTQAWFDGEIQKIVSISASFATAEFNRLRSKRGIDKIAHFDSRCFTVPSREEVINTLIFRQQDGTRNSITSAAQSVYSHSELMGKSGDEKQEMLFQRGINWNDYPVGQKRGRIIKKDIIDIGNGVMRSKWIVDDNIPIFTQDRKYLYNLIPDYDIVQK